MGLDLVKQDEETQKIKTQVKTCINIYTHINIGGGNEPKKYILEQQHLIALTKVEIEAVSSSKAKKRTYFVASNVAKGLPRWCHSKESPANAGDTG